MEPLIRLLSHLVVSGPDPEGADAWMRRFLAAAAGAEGGLPACLPDDAAARAIALLISNSPALSRELIREPRLTADLVTDPWLRQEKPESAMQAERRAAGDDVRTLRRYRAREYLRLGLRELGYGSGVEVGRELAALAATLLDGALAMAWRETTAQLGEPIVEATGRRARFVVMGMGKLGGEELNFSSDIDLIYLYETDAGQAGAVSLHEYFARLAERLTRLVGESTDDGAGFRVDLRLRPEGSRGPLCNSLPAAEQYYETWGRPWERQAWIKARPVAGDRDLGDEALARLAPYVWPRISASQAIGDVQEMMRKVRAELGDTDDVKLGPGGIREIEFFVQALQRVHGGRRAELRERGTLRALDRLLFAGLVSEREQRLLGEAYVFLRRVEHRLQLEELRQTHALPPPGTARALLARRLGYPRPRGFDAALGAHRGAVSEIYATLGKVDAAPPAPVAVLLDPTSDHAALELALAALGFRDPTTSAEEMELLRRKPRSPFAPTAQGASARGAPLLLEDASRSPDPDLALRRLVDLATRGAPAEVVWRLAGDAPAIGRLLVNLFGTSDFLSKILVAHPELAELLLAGPALIDEPFPDRAAHRKAIALRLEPLPIEEEEARLDELRRYRNEALVGVGLRDVAGDGDVEQVSHALSALAEACLAATLEIVTPAVLRQLGRPETTLAVIGLGKLGAGELSYASDLDLIFVFGDEQARVAPGPGRGRGGGEAPSAFEIMSRLAQRLIHGLGAFLTAGRLYEVDTRLRPSGQQGALVSSLAGFERYHSRDAALWERQALIKARTVAGDRELGAEVEAITRRHVWEGPPLDADAAAQEIGRLRARMERELSHESSRHLNIKSGRGGILDVEFLVQYLQLVHGPRLPAVRCRGTREALDALHAAGVLDGPTWGELSTAWRFLRRLENRVRIVSDRPLSQISVETLELDRLARRLGFREANAGAHLLEEYRSHAASVRAIYGRWLPSPTAV